jgi:hypothetical protein
MTLYGDGILAGLSIADIRSLPLETTINPEAEGELRVSVGAARALASIWLLEMITDDLAKHIVKNTKGGEDLEIYFRQWNEAVVESRTTAEELKHETLAGVMEILDQYDGNSHSVLKNMTLASASLFIAQQAGAVVFEVD